MEKRYITPQGACECIQLQKKGNNLLNFLALIVLDPAVELHTVMKYPGQERCGPTGESLEEKSENDKHLENQTCKGRGGEVRT